MTPPTRLHVCILCLPRYLTQHDTDSPQSDLFTNTLVDTLDFIKDTFYKSKCLRIYKPLQAFPFSTFLLCILFRVYYYRITSPASQVEYRHSAPACLPHLSHRAYYLLIVKDRKIPCWPNSMPATLHALCRLSVKMGFSRMDPD